MRGAVHFFEGSLGQGGQGLGGGVLERQGTEELSAVPAEGAQWGAAGMGEPGDCQGDEPQPTMRRVW
jgi:hypothetical protein